MGAPMSFTQLQAYARDQEASARHELKRMVLDHQYLVREWLDEIEREIKGGDDISERAHNCVRGEFR